MLPLGAYTHETRSYLWVWSSFYQLQRVDDRPTEGKSLKLSQPGVYTHTSCPPHRFLPLLTPLVSHVARNTENYELKMKIMK